VEIGNDLQGFGLDKNVKNKWLWIGLNQVGIDVFNVAEDDVAELMNLGVELKKNDRLISANLLSKQNGEPLLNPYVIKMVPIPGSEKKLRLGLLGVSARENNASLSNAAYLWADPLASVAKWLPELRPQCDFLVVVACMPSRDAVQLAINNTNIDAILNGYKHQYATPLATINQSQIFYAEDEGRILGELRFTIKRGENIKANSIDHVLTSIVSDDPEMSAFIAQAKQEIATTQNEIAKAAPPRAVAPMATATNFMTSQKCAACHARQFSLWANSKHAHALGSLQQSKKEFDSACVGCHVTGLGKPGGFIDLYKTPAMANVQCEACHGAGKEHTLKPVAIKMKTQGQATCLVCHTKSNSPEFQFEPYWKKIAH
jgi:hypothetical protein